LLLPNQALALAAEDPQVLYWTAVARERKHKRQEALHLIEKALEKGLVLRDVLRNSDLSNLRSDAVFVKLSAKLNSEKH